MQENKSTCNVILSKWDVTHKLTWPLVFFCLSHHNAIVCLNAVQVLQPRCTPYTHRHTELETGRSRSVISSRLWQEAVWWIHYANDFCQELFSEHLPHHMTKLVMQPEKALLKNGSVYPQYMQTHMHAHAHTQNCPHALRM